MSNFSCLDKGVESFLKNKALEFDKRNVARTYLLIDADKFLAQEIVILAYFTLSIKPLEFNQDLSKTKIKEIDGFSKNAKAIGTILIGQLGKDALHGHLRGSYILNTAISMVYELYDIVGCRIVLLECLPIEKLLSFYSDNGFIFLQKSKSLEYLQLIRFL